MALVTVTRSGFDAEGVRGTGDDERSSLLCSFIGPPSLQQSSTCPFPKRRTGINAEPVGYDGGQSSCISPATLLNSNEPLRWEKKMMSFWCLALAVIASALAAPATLPAREPKKIVPILKQINQLNDDGSYTFGYEGGDGSFRVETKDTTGFTKGRYGYIDLEGKSHVLEYVAGKEAGSSVGFVPSGALVPIPIVRSIATPEQKALDFQYSSVDDDEDGMPDKVQGQAVSILSPASVPVVIPPQQQKIGQFFQQPTFIRTSPAVIVRQQQQPIRKQFAQQDLQFQSVDANEDGIPDQALPSLSFPIFGGRII